MWESDTKKQCFSGVGGKVKFSSWPTGLRAGFTLGNNILLSLQDFTRVHFLQLCCLFILFIFRKVRKTSVTWVLVSLCGSMLIFNLLFVFGIENSNKNQQTSKSDTDNIDLSSNEMLREDIIFVSNPKCTVIAALLHYFLLATFTWMGLSAGQLYFLLMRTMKPLPQHFILFLSLIGWGKCLFLYLEGI